MAESQPLRNPWLIATWPGMGNVALAAGSYLVNKLPTALLAELPSRDTFDIEHVEVKDGVAAIGRLPRSVLFASRDPARQHDLLIFVGEAQPTAGRYAFCQKLLDIAQTYGVQRVYTFAAMATQLHPTDDPRVFAAGTTPDLVSQLEKLEVEILKEGQISGLNGVLLGAAAERGLEGICLLGELPFFAVGVPNPKASRAVLQIFSEIAKLDLDFTELDRQAEAVQEYLLELLQKLTESAEQEGGAEAGDEDQPAAGETKGLSPKPAPNPAPKPSPAIDNATRQRIEAMFHDARRDRSKAMDLKRELDRLGVFKQYEDRFLDLFRKAE